VNRKHANLKVRCKGFTLIELLVVIAIIAVLASLLLPAFSHGKFQAKNTTCKNNLRQIGVATQTYASSYSSYPPLLTFVDNSALPLEWDQVLEKEMAPERNISPFYSDPVSSGFYSRSRVHPSFTCPFLVPIWPLDPQRNPLGDAGSRYGTIGGELEGPRMQILSETWA